MITVKDILNDGRVEIYEFNYSLFAPTMCGAMLYKGESKYLKNSPILNRKVLRIFDYITPMLIIE